jgi:hypothetical protein
MRALWIPALVAVTTAGWVEPAHAYDVVVPETTYSTVPVDMTVASTALLDADSVIVTYTEHVGIPDIATTKLTVVTIPTSPRPCSNLGELESLAFLAFAASWLLQGAAGLSLPLTLNLWVEGSSPSRVTS